MSITSVDIVNGALAKFGEAAILSLDDGSYAGRLASREYDRKRQALTRMHRWNFATKRAVLAPLSTAPLFGNTYQFQLPADYLRLIGLYDAQDEFNDRCYTSGRIPYRVEGGKLLCDYNPVYVIYTADITDPDLMDPLYIVALEWFLAVTFVVPLTNSSAKQGSVQNGFMAAMKEAKAANAIETESEVVVAGDWVDSRFVGNVPHGWSSGIY